MASAVPSVPGLSLPTGGGAIRGIGEKFSTNLATGTASFSIPVASAPGRAGFAVDIELGYDAGVGNGVFGVGFRLSVPAISRKTDKGLPRYLDADESDVFVLSGAEDLVPVHTGGVIDSTVVDGHRVRRYRPRVEGLFARIERWTSEATGETHWRVVSRDNLTSIYGRSPGARVADPSSPERVFSWLHEETRDDRGNVAIYRYKPEDGVGVDAARASETGRFEPGSGSASRFVATAQRYLERICYGNRVPLAAGAAASEDPADYLFEVVFDYGERDAGEPKPDAAGRSWPVRRDPFSSHRAGFEVRTYRLCRRVLVFHRFEELGDEPCLVRSTDLTYEEGPFLTFLSGVEQAGYVRAAGGGYARVAMPPLLLGYERLAALSDEAHSVEGASLEGLPAGVDGVSAQWVDLDGEGVPGVLRAGERGWYYKANLGGGELAPPALMRTLPAPAELGGGLQQLVDLEGNGTLDLVRYAPPLSGYFARAEDGSWGPFAALDAVPNIDWHDANLRVVDLDGDGHPDVLVTEHDAFVWYRSRAREGFDPPRRVAKGWDEDRGPALVFADGTESIHLADMSGDGLSDLVRVRNGEVCYWPNLGHGRFGPKVTMEQSPRFDASGQFDPKRVRFADVDGSGTSDIVYLGRDAVTIFLNQAGNGFAEATSIRSLPLADTLSSITVVDLLGRGTSCLVWSTASPASALRRLCYVDLTGGVKPHLLVSIDNGRGVVTRIHHAASTKYYLADKAAGQRWITRLPFPVHVVERVVTYDRISKSRFTTRYAYHHGYFDGVEREFRGFGMVEQWDTEELSALSESGELGEAENLDAASHVPPVWTKTWFHTGVFAGGEGVSTLFAREYYREEGLTELEVLAGLLPDTVLDDAFSPDEMREACRALKGSILRQEVYALDASSASGRPYTVSERNYTVERRLPCAEGRFGVFFVHPRETVDFHHERTVRDVAGRQVADPRVSHQIVLAVDDYGNVLRSATIGYGRRHDDPDPALTVEDREEQRRPRITLVESRTTNAVDTPSAHRGRQNAESTTYEVVQLQPSSSLPHVTNLFRWDELDRACRELEGGTRDLAYEDIEARGVIDGRPHRRPIERVRTLYRRDDLDGELPLGGLGSRGIVSRTLRLALTPSLVSSLFGARVTDAMLTRGGHVHSEGDASWWVPSERAFFSPDPAHTAAEELAEARAHFFVPRRFRDPFERDHVVTYDRYDLLVLDVEDAAHNRVTAGERDVTGKVVSNGNDYRMLAPRLLMDPNRNRTAVAFDARGLVVGTAVMGKPEESLGDSLEGFVADLPDAIVAAHLADPLASPHALLGGATSRIVYDVFAYQRSKDSPEPQPLVACTLVRETHSSDLVAGERTKIQHSLSYSDGFGREIQKKTQAEPGPLAEGGPELQVRWVGTGWTVFNNKGKPVRRYEPFFTATHRYERGRAVGVSSIVLYDPLERPVGTVHPERLYEKVVFDAWKHASWDVQDTVTLLDPATDPDVGDRIARLPSSDYLPTWYVARQAPGAAAEERAAADKAAVHAGTPTLTYLDALGRPRVVVAHNKLIRDGVVLEERYRTATRLDIEGNAREIVDAKGRVVARYGYDMLGRRLRHASMEAGERWVLQDVAGKTLFTWDSLGRAFVDEYDELRRLVRVTVRGADPDDPARVIVHEVIEYGEAHPRALELNLRGRVLRHRDAAGTLTHVGQDSVTGVDEAYDFKGNALRTERRLAAGYDRLVDWTSSEQLEQEVFASSTRYDALNRPRELVSPDGTRLRPRYNEANLLEAIEGVVRGAGALTTFVEDIDHDARGRRTRVAYGNGAVTTYAYDPLSFRLLRLVTKRNGGADTLQYLEYTYDAAGNVVAVRDGAQQTIFFAQRRVEPRAEYVYDALYRLVEATGREHTSNAALVPVPTSASDAPRVGLAHPNDGQQMARYLQRYVYDEVGNLLEMAHRGTDPSRAGWTRTYEYEEESQIEPGVGGAPGKVSNRLTRTVSGDESTGEYSYDARGNMLSMPHLPLVRWDHLEQLRATSRQKVSSGTPEITYYVYDAFGERVRKVTVRQAAAGARGTRKSERIYLGGLEIYREYDTDGRTITLERETVHVMDDKQRVAIIESRTRGDDGSPARLTRYQLGNHLGSAALELDGGPLAEIISYEEYYPYGSTSYHASRSKTEAAKRYRYTGKERDEESGLYYHGARYYAPWLARWTSCDPEELVDGVNVYAYGRGCPTKWVDPTGTQSRNPQPRAGESYAQWQARAQSQAGGNTPLTTDQVDQSWRSAHALSRAERRQFGAAGATIQNIDNSIEEQIGSARAQIRATERRFQRRGWRLTPGDTQRFRDRINQLQDLRAQLGAELRAGSSHGIDLLTLANIVLNEAGTANQRAKEGVAYAWMNRTQGVVRTPTGSEISNFRTLRSRWAGASATGQLTMLPNLIASIHAARVRLSDASPSQHDPTGGATHWVSPIGLRRYSSQADRYSRTVGNATNRAFPLWARATNDPEVAHMQSQGRLGPNYAEVALSGVPREQFLFYRDVR